jgi:hypothetical protein
MRTSRGERRERSAGWAPAGTALGYGMLFGLLAYATYRRATNFRPKRQVSCRHARTVHLTRVRKRYVGQGLKSGGILRCR